jgi:hypothetical protein
MIKRRKKKMEGLYRSIFKTLFLIILLCIISSGNLYGASAIPEITEPIKITAESYPFNAADHSLVPQDLSKYKYIEEEYFISGKANIYDFNDKGEVIVRTPDAPYTTRILIRRPELRDSCSGNVIIELLNPTANYDMDLQWMFCNNYFMENGDIWVGITVKPVSAKALKTFNPIRYAPMSWKNPLPLEKTCKEPSGGQTDTKPETENGLAWDIVSQVGALLKSDLKQNPLKTFGVKYLYATGYSQTGGYLVTYINFIRPLDTALLESGKPIYDGYLIGDGDSFAMPLNQCSMPFPPVSDKVLIRPRKEPVISIVTQGLLQSTASARRPDSDAPDDRYRRYEIPGSAHINQKCQNGTPSPEDTQKAGVPVSDIKCVGLDEYGLTDFPFEILMNGAFASLDIWVRSGTAPPKAPVISIKSKPGETPFQMEMDEHGNVLGGLRTPHLDVPVATYYGKSALPEGKSDPLSVLVCTISGYKVPFTKEKIKKLYPTREEYLKKFKVVADSLKKEKFITASDYKRMMKEAESVTAW